MAEWRDWNPPEQRNGQKFKKARTWPPCLASFRSNVPQEATADVWHQQAGEPYLRKLLIHGARSCVMHLDRSRDRLGAWLRQLHSRMHVNKVTVALAAKIARIAWVVLNRPGAIYERRDPALA